MGFRRGAGAVAGAIALTFLGAAMLAAWQHGLWAALAGAAIAATWLIILSWWARARPRIHASQAERRTEEEVLPLRLLLDQVPVPLVSLDGTAARVINRSARALFSTDDRILPYPTALGDQAQTHFLHEGRRWRIDRVDAHGGAGRRTIAALIDFEAEQRAAEASVAADMIQVLGHELLNGLAPIVSLAESGVAALEAPTPNMALLSEILTTLARRVEGLLRFTEAYRAMARLPDPTCAPVSLAAIADDLAILFAGRWNGSVALDAALPDLVISADRDQLSQAIWALLQNGAEAALQAGDQPAVEATATVDGGAVLIQVRDSGPGVPAEEVSRIFRPFHTTKPEGTGVGLALARQIAHAHGGDLTVSEAGPTTFTLLLPTEP